RVALPGDLEDHFIDDGRVDPHLQAGIEGIATQPPVRRDLFRRRGRRRFLGIHVLPRSFRGILNCDPGGSGCHLLCALAGSPGRQSAGTDSASTAKQESVTTISLLALLTLGSIFFGFLSLRGTDEEASCGEQAVAQKRAPGDVSPDALDDAKTMYRCSRSPQ